MPLFVCARVRWLKCLFSGTNSFLFSVPSTRLPAIRIYTNVVSYTVVTYSYIFICSIGRIGTAQASHVEGREFDSQSNQISDLQN